jgi:hypothetical protein
METGNGNKKNAPTDHFLHHVNEKKKLKIIFL